MVDNICETGSMHGRKKSVCKNLVGKPKERNLLSNFDVDGRIILK
jgi:hypothetical protein